MQPHSLSSNYAVGVAMGVAYDGPPAVHVYMHIHSVCWTPQIVHVPVLMEGQKVEPARGVLSGLQKCHLLVTKHPIESFVSDASQPVQCQFSAA